MSSLEFLLVLISDFFTETYLHTDNPWDSAVVSFIPMYVFLSALTDSCGISQTYFSSFISILEDSLSTESLMGISDLHDPPQVLTPHTENSNNNNTNKQQQQPPIGLPFTNMLQ